MQKYIYMFLQGGLLFHLGQIVCNQTIQQPVRVLSFHDELCKRSQVDHPNLLHHQLVLSSHWFKPVCASETGPEDRTSLALKYETT